jgi:hypothetical protein
LVITYKACTAGDIPATEVLIEGRGPIKHIGLNKKLMENVIDDWLRALVPSKAIVVMD